ncbi:MarR family transcriptional regulator [Leptospira perolatii]|uniref:MarR family transcriptional regulator n=1 Tax=Leptospira perolatii TaxID=2023191 RepID=A0A2M9ZQI3_9LEPT|nr:MarR family transcriptional regulator [Leptospira perolatii]PJZ70496.1 MarR family transcriptional regulator [Leptospira perolatii]PJZ74332.1 MarR family transcriptional regulator [Leptospira perolatii]
MKKEKSNSGPSLIDTAFAYYYYRVERLVRMHFSQLMIELGEDISIEQWILINRLAETGSSPQSELVDKTFKDRPNVTRLLDGLEKRNLVERIDDPGDRRKFEIRLTKDGRALLDRMVPKIKKERAVVYDGLGKKDLDSLKKISEKIEENILHSKVGKRK